MYGRCRQQLRGQLGLSVPPDAALSIIIPVGPGDRAWHGLLDQLANITPSAELLLVFTDRDPQRAEAPTRYTALTAPAGRAHQLNAGITHASGQWLWLLHADSRLRRDTLPALRAHLANGPAVLGWFRLAFTADGPWQMPLNAFGANLRARWTGLPFGDQGFVLRRDDAHRIGPFDPTLAHGEDHAWIWQARRVGMQVRPVNGTLATSARRYAEHGWLRITMQHLRLTAQQAWRESRR